MRNLVLLTKFLSGQTARNTGWMLVGYVFRVVFQTLSFIYLARVIGPDGYGAVAAALSVVALISPFVELGAYSLVVRDITAGIPTRVAVGNILTLLLLTFPLGLSVLILIKLLFLPKIPWAVILGLGIGQLIGGRILTLVQGVNIANRQLHTNSLLELISGVLLLGSVYTLQLVGGKEENWGVLYAIYLVVVGIIGLVITIASWGKPQGTWKEVKGRIKPGVHFAIGLASQNAYTDLDKAMLAKMASLEIVGLYAAAHRLTQVAFLPLSAVLTTTYPKFFEEGQKSVRSATKLALRMLPITMGYTFLVSVFLWFASPLAPVLLGQEFQDSSHAIRFLTFSLILQSIYTPFADALTGSGHQVARTRAQLMALLLSVLLNLWLIPLYGWIGAAVATLASQLMLTVAVIWGVVGKMAVKKVKYPAD